MMAKVMKTTAIVLLLLTVASALLYRSTCHGGMLAIAITFGTAAYHFCMRLLVGWMFNTALKNHVDYRRRWFQVSEAEFAFYKKIGVKKWKHKMPTYDKDAFDKRKHSWDEIAQAMCQAELVHEVIVLLSFVPLVFAVWFGDLPVFVVTSVLAAGVDLVFVIMQRFNRLRIIKFIEKEAC